MELKTSMTIRGPQDEGRFEKYDSMISSSPNKFFLSILTRKLLKFYFQSFLLGVPVSHALDLELLTNSDMEHFAY